MRKIASRMPRRAPARRSAANDDPYSTSLCSPRWYHTRCGISCTSGYAPVTSDERQTGVSDGKTVAARRYSPRSWSSARAGAVRRSTASSYIAGVNPSMTIRSALVAGKDPKACVALVCPPADAEAQDGQRQRDEVAEHRNEREPRQDERRSADQQRRACARAAACQRAVNGRGGTDGPEHPADRARDRAGPLGEEPPGARGAEQRDGNGHPGVAEDGDGEHAERGSEPRADADPVPSPHSDRVY